MERITGLVSELAEKIETYKQKIFEQKLLEVLNIKMDLD